jgi:hypothetical protein
MLRIQRALSTLLSGCAVYVIMAACSAGGGGSAGSGPLGDASGSASSSGGTDATASSSASSSSGSSGTTTSSGSPVPNAMADTWYASGSRLKLRYFESSDGAKQFTGWADSARSNEECAFAWHADLSWRCVPTPTAQPLIAFFGAADCTSTPLSLVAKTVLAAPSYFYSYAQTSAGPMGIRMYTAGAKIATPGTVYSGTPAACSSSAGGSLATVYDFYNLGAEVPSTAFADAAKKTAP